ncbi:MAG TPA: PEP-CTERM/exosortase system-associated acyltransferase [Cellvibrio sp.]|nr:PEP-CTERM/exosortase system-associated acyltransferase [Cellvibrio sp.]
MKPLRQTLADNIVSPAPQRNAATLASDEAETIAKHFSNYLQPQIAKSILLKQEVYKLRYQVYCEELHYEETNAEHIEQDEFDFRSIHCFIRHLGSGSLAGTLRLITTLNTDQLLPMEKFCPHAISDEHLQPRNFLPHQICEISRLAVPLAFRKRQVDQFAGGATGVINEQTFSTQEFRFFPYIAISLYLSAITLCHKSRIHHVFVMMEPRLARSLNFVGIHFTQIGAPVEYHGKRAAYYVDVRQLRKNLSGGYRKLLATIEKGMFS